MLSCITFTNTVFGQENLKTVTIEQITDPFWKRTSKFYWGKTKLPYYESKKVSREYRITNQSYRLCTFDKKKINHQLPLYALPDTNIQDSEQYIVAVFYNTNGNYFIDFIEAWSGDHRSQKGLLATFDFCGKLCDYIPFSQNFEANPLDEANPQNANTIEGVINKDLTVDTNTLELNDPYPIDQNFNVKPGLHGQRIDRRYKITPQGKFEIVSETVYFPQDYTAKELTGSKCIADGGETPMK